jgi:hypothetical protein
VNTGLCLSLKRIFSPQARSREKMVNDYNNNPAMLKDLARVTLEYEDCAGLLKALERHRGRRAGEEQVRLAHPDGVPRPQPVRQGDASGSRRRGARVRGAGEPLHNYLTSLYNYYHFIL